MDGRELPLKFHPATTRAPAAFFDKPNDVARATGGNAKLPNSAALDPVAAMTHGDKSRQ